MLLNPNNQFENIVTPFTDGIARDTGCGQIEKCYDTKGRDMVLALKNGKLAMMMIRGKTFTQLDDLTLYKRFAEQKDPLLIYKLDRLMFRVWLPDQ